MKIRDVEEQDIGSGEAEGGENLFALSVGCRPREVAVRFQANDAATDSVLPTQTAGLHSEQQIRTTLI